MVLSSITIWPRQIPLKITPWDRFIADKWLFQILCNICGHRAIVFKKIISYSPLLTELLVPYYFILLEKMPLFDCDKAWLFNCDVECQCIVLNMVTYCIVMLLCAVLAGSLGFLHILLDSPITLKLPTATQGVRSRKWIPLIMGNFQFYRLILHDYLTNIIFNWALHVCAPLSQSYPLTLLYFSHTRHHLILIMHVIYIGWLVALIY